MTPNAKRRKEQHDKTVATFDILLGGFAPLAELEGTNDLIVISRALEQAAIGIVTVLENMRAESIADYDKQKDWP